jgi:hypothetical protein
MVGSLAQRSGGTLVFVVPQRPLDAVRGYEGVLQRARWRVPVNRASGGFRRLDEIVHSGWFCQGERRSLSATALDRPEGGSFLRVAYGVHEHSSPCEDRRRDEPSFPRGPIPTLYPPEHATIVHAGTGGSRDYMEARARLKTELGPAQLVAHYSAQVRAQGWSLQSESVGPDLSAQMWRIEDREKKTWVGLLMGHSIPGSDERVVIFRVIPQTTGR